MPGRLFRYLLFITAVRTLLALLLLVTLYAALDIVEGSSRLSVGMGAIFRAWPFRLPLAIAHLLPVACALGVALSISTIKRSGEWDAIEATGAGSWRIHLPLLLVPLLCFLIGSFLVHRLAPMAMSRYETAMRLTDRAPMEVALNDDDIAARFHDRGAGWSVQLQRSAAGTLEMVSIDNGSGWITAWKDAHANPLPIEEIQRTDLPSRGPDGLFAASWTTGRLTRLISTFPAPHIPRAPVEAEVALRHAMSLSILLISFAAVMILARFRSLRASVATAIGIALCAIHFWAMVVTWQGAVMGLYRANIIVLVLAGVTVCVVVTGRIPAIRSLLR